MGKLGGKARKFAKKNLQSVLKKKRKLKSFFKKKSSKRGEKYGTTENEPQELDMPTSNGINMEADMIEFSSLDSMLGLSDSDSEGRADGLESDGYISTDAADESFSRETKCVIDESDTGCRLSDENKEILSQIEREERNLEKLKGKLFDEEATVETLNGTHQELGGFILSHGSIESLVELVKEHHNINALVKLVNAYRAACHYGTESLGCGKSQALTKIVMFMLTEGEHIFRKMLGLPSSDGKHTYSDLTKCSSWDILKPMIKCYLRSSLYFLNDLTEPELLTYALKNLRICVSYFSAFPSLLKRLIEMSANLWLSCDMSTSQSAFLIIQDIAHKLKSKWFDLCLSKTYKILIGRCKFDDPALLNHTHYVKNSFVRLCLNDIQKSYSLAVKSVRLLRNILLMAVKTRKKEAIKKVCSWQYVNCIDLWVTFLVVNFSDYDLKLLLSMLVELINGVALLFPGPRYVPLRIKCVKWLNQLSKCGNIFIPVTSLTMNLLECKMAKYRGQHKEDFNLSSSIKLPKHWLKSYEFQEQCVLAAIQLLTMHFNQWSYHISFPELATIPIIRLKTYLDATTTESVRRVVKRFIDQVEQNIKYVQKRRDEVAFSPRDHQSADSFLQLEKGKSITPFMQYYRSVLDNASC